MIDPAELKNLYVDEGLTTSEVATRFGCSAMTILRRLMRFQIPVRPRGTCPKHADRRRGLTPAWAAWSPALAYAVGLIATDGNLSPDGRHLSIPSKDLDLLESLRGCLGLTNSIGRHSSARGHIHRLQWGDRLFYDWLQSIGLTPAKSLTLGPLAVPDEYFVDFFRGCIDGDGSITTYVDRYNTFKKPDVRVYAPLRLDRLGQSALRGVAADHGPTDHWAFGRARRPKVASSP